MQQLQLRPTVQVFAPDLAVPDGRLDLALTLAGTRQQPQGQGRLSLTAVQWQKRQLGDIQATVGLSGTIVQTDVHWQVQGHPLLQVRGTMRLDTARALDVQVQAPMVNLDMLGPLSPAVQQSAGLLTLDLHVTGTLQQPQVQGELLLRDGVLQLVATGERYQDIQVRLIFAGDRVTIERLAAGVAQWTLQVTGWFEHDHLALRQIDLALSARNFTAMHTSAVVAAVSADITVRGTLQEVTVAGSVTVPSGAPAPGAHSWERTESGPALGTHLLELGRSIRTVGRYGSIWAKYDKTTRRKKPPMTTTSSRDLAPVSPTVMLTARQRACVEQIARRQTNPQRLVRRAKLLWRWMLEPTTARLHARCTSTVGPCACGAIVGSSSPLARPRGKRKG